MMTSDQNLTRNTSKQELSTKAKRELERCANAFKEKLDQLICPYTEGIEARCILDMLMRPGEARIRLLQWLFSRLDDKLNDLLDPQFAPSNTRMDSRIQRLLFVASSLGFCKTDDADLIRGTVSASRQRIFIEQLLDIVCIYDTSADVQARALGSPGVLSEASCLEQQWQQDCCLISTLAEELDMSSLCNPQISLLPPDLMKTIQANRQQQSSNVDVAYLQKQAEDLSSELAKQNGILTELTSLYPYQGHQKSSTTAKMSQTMSLVLSELSQLVVGFSYCYENELQPWCNKAAPQLNDLGPAFKHVHAQLKQFTQLLQNLNTMKTSYNHLCKAVKTNDETRKIGLVSSAALESFQECVDILDESLMRHERSVNSTLHMSKISVT